MTRADVHASSGSRLGAAHPRQEGPADLRLVPPALAAWGAAALALDAPAEWVAVAAGACVAVAGGLLVVGGRCGVGGRSGAGLRGSGRMPGRVPGRARVVVRALAGRGAVALVAVLLCAAAAATSASLHGADLRRGPVPSLARHYAEVTAELEITSDPRRTRPRVTGDHQAPPAVVVEADLVGVTTEPARKPAALTRTRAPVLVITPTTRPGTSTAPPDSSRDPDSGPILNPRLNSDPSLNPRTNPRPNSTTDPTPNSPWLNLLPSTRIQVRARLAPPLEEGVQYAAVARVTGKPVGPTVLSGPSRPQRLAGTLRSGLRKATEGLPADGRALVPGLVIGDTSRVPPELTDAFRATDLTHLLAVSGANLTIVLALLIGPPGRAQLAERRGLAPRLGIPLRATALLGGGLTLSFVVVCRPDPSVLRAAACGVIVLLALATGRRRSLIPALAAAVLALVLYDPWLSRSYGFLLSVLATGALLTVAPKWSDALEHRRVPPRLAAALAAAAAAQAVCAPVVVVLAARVSLVAVPCNLLAEFAVAPATVLGFAALAAAPVAMPVAKALAWGAGWPAGWIADIARTGAALPGGGVDWPGGWTGGLLLVLVTGAVVLFGRRLPRHPWIAVACALLLVLIVVQPAPLTRVFTGWPPPGWRYALCDVGQGDAMVLAAGAGTGVVVDAGPDPVPVDRCLRSLGVTRVPLVLLTHFHADHVAGLEGVLRGRSVGAIQTTGYEEPPGQAAFVRERAAAHHVPVIRAVAGERRRAGTLDWRVLWPQPPPGPPPDGPNDASVTLLVRTAGLTLLLLGDLEPPAQRALLRTPALASLPPVDVLKVAHHGSAYQDPLLLRRVAPRLALISCGADNPYGHPSRRTVAALAAGGARVLRTDRDGSIAVAGRAGEGGAAQEWGVATR
ncbi:ComEC/Rec2 family competence protein [Streptomyces sp. NPDC059009]|uniref:ComEC/Rec2 family competence protein n=1 Tax=Streptomyces sp. NPDC059009 TaxID=3346694 RepID=UPI0036A1DBC5